MSRLAIKLSALLLVGLLGCSPVSPVDPASGKASANESEQFSDHPNDQAKANKAANTSKTRSFQFNYRFDLVDMEPGKQIRIWMPVPQSSDYQQVTALPHKLPFEPVFGTEAKYNNRILYIEATVPTNGTLSLDVPYHVTRQEVRTLQSDNKPALSSKVASNQANKTSHQIETEQEQLFLEPSAKVPVQGKPLELLEDIQLNSDPLTLANQLYDAVDSHVTYNKEGTGWGNGDVLWVCDSGRGNCTDFHSLFISLARSQGIPARFEIGFPIPSQDRGNVGGYHCWAYFHTETRGWVPVDISEADKHPSLKDYYFGSLTPDRVTFSIGRDIELVPPAAAGSLNYFVYPHLEMDGKAVSREHIELKFSYEDTAAAQQ